MPPKNVSKPAPAQPNKKTEQKKKEKIIEDKTFGLKNKKGAKQQKFIAQVQKQVLYGANKSQRSIDKEKDEQKLKKDEKKKELMELNNIFRPVQALAKGADPKSVLCAFFKVGQCMKGDKCRFSHDLTVERKSEKRSMFVDLRLADGEEPCGSAAGNKPQSKIVCKHFLDAVEHGQFGWFWECPNGDKCVNVHALPEGYILRKDKKKMEKQEEVITIEELVERERAALGINLTPVTLETFSAWKQNKLAEKEEKLRKETEKKRNDYKSGKETGLSGRDVFTFNEGLAVDGLDEGDESIDLAALAKQGEEEDGEEEDVQFKDIDNCQEDSEVQQNDSMISVANPDRLLRLKEDIDAKAAVMKVVYGIDADEAIAIDEELFAGDDEDLNELDEQLEELAVS